MVTQFERHLSLPVCRRKQVWFCPRTQRGATEPQKYSRGCVCVCVGGGVDEVCFQDVVSKSCCAVGP